MKGDSLLSLQPMPIKPSSIEYPLSSVQRNSEERELIEMFRRMMEDEMTKENPSDIRIQQLADIILALIKVMQSKAQMVSHAPEHIMTLTKKPSYSSNVNPRIEPPSSSERG